MTAPTLTVEIRRTDIFIYAGGVLIAKRGHKGTPQARTWVSLEPGWSVLDSSDGDLIVEFKETTTH